MDQINHGKPPNLGHLCHTPTRAGECGQKSAKNVSPRDGVTGHGVTRSSSTGPLGRGIDPNHVNSEPVKASREGSWFTTINPQEGRPARTHRVGVQSFGAQIQIVNIGREYMPISADQLGRFQLM